MIDFKHDNCAKIMILKCLKYIQNMYEWKQGYSASKGANTTSEVDNSAL